jgi:hypothetical protein
MSGISVNDFTHPVTYVVIAADGTTTSYTVTVTIAVATCTAMTGLIAYYDFDDNTNDVDTGTYDMTGTNLTRVTGKLGHAYSFDGSTSTLAVSAGSFTLAASTLCAWVQPVATAGSGQPLFVGGAEGSGDLHGVAAASDQSGTCAGGSATGLYTDHWNTGCYYSDQTAPSASWTFVCFSWDGDGTVGYYANGSYSTDSGTFYSYDLATMTVGSTTLTTNSTTALSFDGIIDEVSFWSRALSQTELDTLYADGSGCRVK